MWQPIIVLLCKVIGITLITSTARSYHDRIAGMGTCRSGPCPRMKPCAVLVGIYFVRIAVIAGMAGSYSPQYNRLLQISQCICCVFNALG